MFVYILLCKNRTTYTGVTHNLRKRFEEHRRGYGANYTKKYGVEKILYVEYYPTEKQALKRELEIKGWDLYSKVQLINDTLNKPIVVREKDPVTKKWIKLRSPRMSATSVPSQHFGKILQGSNFIPPPKRNWF